MTDYIIKSIFFTHFDLLKKDIKLKRNYKIKINNNLVETLGTLKEIFKYLNDKNMKKINKT